MLVSAEELIKATQIFTVIHGTLWVAKHSLTSERHQIIRSHVRERHSKHFTKCQTAACATQQSPGAVQTAG